LRPEATAIRAKPLRVRNALSTAAEHWQKKIASGCAFALIAPQAPLGARIDPEAIRDLSFGTWS